MFNIKAKITSQNSSGHISELRELFRTLYPASV